jgi:hypothetical protein
MCLHERADGIGTMRVSRAASVVHCKEKQETFDEVKILKEKLLVEFKSFKNEMIKLYEIPCQDVGKASSQLLVEARNPTS